MTKLTINLGPVLKKARVKWKKRNDEMRNTRGPHARIAILLDVWVQRNFKSEGGNVGVWKPFAIRKDGRRGRWVKGKGLDTSAKLLQDTGQMRLSFIPFTTVKTAGIGSDLDRSKEHNPVRRMLPNDKDVKPMVNRVWKKHIKKAYKK